MDNNGTYTTIDPTGSINTYVTGIDGNNIVGYYEGSGGVYHGFLDTVPEPSTLVLLLTAGSGPALLRLWQAADSVGVRLN